MWKLQRVNLGLLALVPMVVASGCEELPDEDPGAQMNPLAGDGGEGDDEADAAAIEDAAADVDSAVDSAVDGGAEQAPDGGHDDAGDPDANVGDASAQPSAAFAPVYALLAANCVSCHGDGKKLDLSTAARAYEGLVGVSAKYGSCISDGGAPKIRVVAGDPAASLLLDKLGATPSCGKPMPTPNDAGVTLLPADSIETIRAWIAGGAH